MIDEKMLLKRISNRVGTLKETSLSEETEKVLANEIQVIKGYINMCVREEKQKVITVDRNKENDDELKEAILKWKEKYDQVKYY